MAKLQDSAKVVFFAFYFASPDFFMVFQEKQKTCQITCSTSWWGLWVRSAKADGAHGVGIINGDLLAPPSQPFISRQHRADARAASGASAQDECLDGDSDKNQNSLGVSEDSKVARWRTNIIKCQ